MIGCAWRAGRLRYVSPSGNFTWDTSTTNWTLDTVAAAWPTGGLAYQALISANGNQTITPGVASLYWNQIVVSGTGTKTFAASGTNTLRTQGANPSIWVTSGSGMTVSAPINSPNKLYKMDAGQLTLSATNTFTAGLVVGNGTLSVGTAACLGSGGLTLGGMGYAVTFDCQLAGLTTLSPSPALTISSDVTFTAGATTDLRFGASGATIDSGGVTITGTQGNLFLGGAITGGKITKTGAFTLAFQSASTAWTAGYTATAGRTLLNATNCIASGAPVTLGSSGVTTTIDNTAGSAGSAITLSNQSWVFDGAVTYTGTRGITLSSCDLTVTSTTTCTISANSLTFTGAVINAALTKAGALGTLTLGGDVSGTGSLTLSAGTLAMSKGQTIAVPITLSGGTLTNTASPAAGITSSSTLTITASSTVTGTAAGNTWTWTGGVTFTGSVTITTSQPVTFNCAVSGTYLIGKAGASTLTLTSANTTGGWSISAGKLIVGNVSALGTANATSISAGATLDCSSGGLSSSASISAGGTFVWAGTAMLDAGTGANVGQTLAITGGISCSSGAKLTITANGGSLSAGSWVAVSYTGTATNPANLTLTSNSVGGRTLSLAHDGTAKTWTVTAV